ncbi:MAG: aminoglycoside phosphotransferase family protein [Bacillota bacterium]|nr:aminoglycoside phosphotransferase family protein [Bacillota bacterium]
MPDKIRQDQQYIACLTDFVREAYGLEAISIVPAKRGYYGETWRLNTEKNCYFLKLDYSSQHQVKYRNSLEVVEYLCASGIDFISRIIKTRADNLFSIFNSAVLCVFNWFDGDNIETDETKIPEYTLLSRIYPLTRPGFEIPSAEFSDERANNFYAQWKQLQVEPPSEENNSILATFKQHQEVLGHYADRLKYFSEICRNGKPRFYITHGDAGGNLMIGNGQYCIVDWDEVMYAPLERDAWFMCCYEWALKAFRDALRQNSITDQLRPECLAFYCYHMFFLYLGEFMNDFTLSGKKQEIENYFNCWIMERMKFADSVI